MNQRYDLLAISLLVFTVVFLSWNIAGPKDFSFKDWQTLTASIVALGAATLAYQSAMAKVDYDRAKELRDLWRKRLGIYLRLRFAASELVRQTGNIKLALGMNLYARNRNVPAYSIKLGEQLSKEFEDAWNNLELFPVTASMAIDYVRSEFAAARKFIGTVPDADVIQVSTLGVTHGSPYYDYLVRCERINEQCRSIGTLITAEIDKMELD
jgi:hypothetical protein